MNYHNLLKGVLCLLFFISSYDVASAATFPIAEDFSGSQPSDWELRSNASWNTTVSGDSTLQLTSAGTSQTGLGFFNDSFPSNLGFVAEFRYYDGGGTGADGFAFFLVDGDLVDETNIEAGALGGALGYAQSTTDPGIPHAYLGVGFDEFGNFVTNSGGMDPGSVSPIPDSVVLRGSGNGLLGYDYLTHRDVSGDFGERIDGGWRTARVTVVPSISNATIRVEMSWDEGATWETVINDYVYNEVPPANLKLGFTGGTGGSTNIHAIGNLNVQLPVDLETNVTVAPAGTYERGDAVTYTFTVENHGPNDSSLTTIENTIPVGALGVDDITWTLNSTHGSTSSGTGADIDEITVSIPKGEVVTVVVNGTIGDGILNTTDLDHTITATPEADSSDPSLGDASVAVTIDTDAPTAAESALLKILAYVNSNGASTTPTEDDYDDAGITGVTSDLLDEVNELMAESDATDSDGVQDVVDIARTPSVSTMVASEAERDRVYLNGDVVRFGAEDIDTFGFEYGLSTSYGANVQGAYSAPGDYSLEIVELTCDTTYHYRAFIENVSAAKWYGADRTVVTEDCAGNTSTRGAAPVASGNNAQPSAVAGLWAQVEMLQKKLAAASAGATTTLVNAIESTVRDLTGGMSGDDVTALQLLLIAQGYPIQAGATGYFASQTKAALAAYQNANGITPAQGYFGAKTRTQMKTAGIVGIWW